MKDRFILVSFFSHCAFTITINYGKYSFQLFFLEVEYYTKEIVWPVWILCILCSPLLLLPLKLLIHSVQFKSIKGNIKSWHIDPIRLLTISYSTWRKMPIGQLRVGLLERSSPLGFCLLTGVIFIYNVNIMCTLEDGWCWMTGGYSSVVEQSAAVR